MTKAYWKKRIKKACVDAGTYQECFDDVIDTLAWVLEQRDMQVKAFENAGGEGVVEHTNKAGATNLEKSPYINLINEFNRDALTYWRDLGLTPKGLKAISDAAMKKEQSSFAEALGKIIGGD